MTQHDRHPAHVGKSTSFWKSGAGVALIMAGIIVAFYLVREHWAHLGQTWPYLLLLLCPLMHLFMHGGRGHSHSESNTVSSDSTHKNDNRAS